MTAVDLDPEWLAEEARERRLDLAYREHHAPYWYEGRRAVGYYSQVPGLFWQSRWLEDPADAARRVLREHYNVPADVRPRVAVLLIAPPEPTP